MSVLQELAELEDLTLNPFGSLDIGFLTGLKLLLGDYTKMKQLEELYLWSFTTRHEFHCAGLDHVMFTNKRHFSHKTQEFKK